MNDLDQLAAVAAGDADVFAQWMAESEHRLRLSLASFATSVDVEAVVQEALLRVWQAAPRLEPNPKGETLLRVAVRVGRNLAITESRRLGRDVEQGEAASPVESSPDPLLRQLVQRCRERLPKKPRAALEARLATGVRHDSELADGLRMQLNTFLQNLSRARKLLKDCLRKGGVELAEVLR